MKITLQSSQFVFDPTTKTVNFDNMFGTFLPERLLAVINTTTGLIIYSAASSPSYSGTFSNGVYLKSVLTYTSTNVGQSASDILQVLYDDQFYNQTVSGTVTTLVNDYEANGIGSVNDPVDGNFRLKTASTTYASDGTPILSTVDPISGSDGLNTHLNSSSFGGTIGNPIPLPNNNNALSVGFLSGGVLVTPALDPVSNQLIVQTAGSVGTQDVNITQVNGTALGGPVIPVDISLQSGPNLETNINIGGLAPATSSGANNAQTLRTSANIALNGTQISSSLGANDAGTVRTASNVAFNGITAATQNGVVTTGTQRVVLATDQPDVATNITKVGGGALSFNQKVMASSIPVVLASDHTTINTALPDTFVTGGATNLLSNNLILPVVGTGSYDAAGFKSGSVQVVTLATSGAFIFEGSNDNTSFQSIPVFRNDSVSPNAIVGAIAVTAASQFIYHFPIKFRYIRLRISTALNNTCQAFTRFSQESWSAIIPNVINATGANLNATISGSLTGVTTVTTLTTCSTVSSVTSAALSATTVTDIASAAITTTQTSANIATGNQQNMAFQVGVSATSGTGQFMDVVVQESFDGTNFYDIYHFPRITAIGQYYSPQMRITGAGIRSVRTVGGTTPSFTNSVLRPVRQTGSDLYRNFLDRTINPTTLSSTTPSFYVEGCDEFQLVANMAAGGTAPVFKMQGSEDNANWFDMPSLTLTATVGAVTQIMTNGTAMPKFIRGIVGTAGAGSSLVCLHLKARGA